MANLKRANKDTQKPTQKTKDQGILTPLFVE